MASAGFDLADVAKTRVWLRDRFGSIPGVAGGKLKSLAVVLSVGTTALAAWGFPLQPSGVAVSPVSLPDCASNERSSFFPVAFPWPDHLNGDN